MDFANWSHKSQVSIGAPPGVVATEKLNSKPSGHELQNGDFEFKKKLMLPKFQKIDTFRKKEFAYHSKISGVAQPKSAPYSAL